MQVVFDLSGTTLFETTMEAIPKDGSIIRIKTKAYKKGLPADSIIDVIVGAEGEPYMENGILHIDVDGYRLIEEGPDPDEGQTD